MHAILGKSGAKGDSSWRSAIAAVNSLFRNILPVSSRESIFCLGARRGLRTNSNVIRILPRSIKKINADPHRASAFANQPASPTV